MVPDSLELIMSPFPRIKLENLPCQRVAAGFSIVEVSLALAIVAIAFVALLALIPPGLSNFRAAMDTQTASEIFQRVVADAQETDFDTLLAAPPLGSVVESGGTGNQFYRLAYRYFDDQGSEVKVGDAEAPSATEAQRIMYSVRVRGSRPGDANPGQHTDSYPTSLPGVKSPRFNPRALTFLSVQVAQTKGVRDLKSLVNGDSFLISPLSAAKGGLPLKTYSAIIARNQ